MRETLSIDILSANSEARTRKEEIAMALNSTYSQQQQELYSIKISNLPNSFIDLSGVEASRRLNRYNISFNVFSWRTKEKSIDYFDTFFYQLYADGKEIVDSPTETEAINFILKK